MYGWTRISVSIIAYAIICNLFTLRQSLNSKVMYMFVATLAGINSKLIIIIIINLSIDDDDDDDSNYQSTCTYGNIPVIVPPIVCAHMCKLFHFFSMSNFFNTTQAYRNLNTLSWVLFIFLVWLLLSLSGTKEFTKKQQITFAHTSWNDNARTHSHTHEQLPS